MSLQWLVLSIVLLSLSGQARGRGDAREEALIGWRGETYKPKLTFEDNAADGADKQARSKALDDGDDRTTRWIQTLSWSPRAFIYHNFLSRSEVKHILQLSELQMKRSMVVGPNDTGVIDSYRTSAGCFLMRNQDPVITAIENRLALWSQLPPSYQEDLQVLRYGPTNKYGPHCDGLGRVMSILIYLVPPEEGGETAFPKASKWLHPDMGEPSQGPFSDCAKGKVAYKPKVGDALMFYDMLPSYKMEDFMSEHTGCPVIKGTKWNAVKWIHGKPFHPEEWARGLKPGAYPPMQDPGVCVNLHERCDEWAAAGECQKNPEYMLGHTDGRGSCRLACEDCEVCAEGDAACLARNRLSAGYMTIDRAEFKGLAD